MFNAAVWKDGERQAEAYMKKHGFKILKTNFSCVGVELDIIALLPKTVQQKNIKLKLKQMLKTADRKEKKMLKISFKTRMKQVNDLLVITEVKARSNDNFGEGSEFVKEQKKFNITKGARYIQSLPEYSKYQIRFDVASVDAGEVNYIEDAF